MNTGKDVKHIHTQVAHTQTQDKSVKFSGQVIMERKHACNFWYVFFLLFVICYKNTVVEIENQCIMKFSFSTSFVSYLFIGKLCISFRCLSELNMQKWLQPWHLPKYAKCSFPSKSRWAVPGHLKSSFRSLISSTSCWAHWSRPSKLTRSATSLTFKSPCWPAHSAYLQNHIH